MPCYPGPILPAELVRPSRTHSSQSLAKDSILDGHALSGVLLAELIIQVWSIHSTLLLAPKQVANRQEYFHHPLH